MSCKEERCPPDKCLHNWPISSLCKGCQQGGSRVCQLQPEAKSWVKLGQKELGQARPKFGLSWLFAWVLEKPKPLAWARAL